MEATVNNNPTTLPLDLRHSRINFVSRDGSTGHSAYPINYDELYNLKGRLLTIIDATFMDPEQRKAQKDVVWQALKGWMDDIEHQAAAVAKAAQESKPTANRLS